MASLMDLDLKNVQPGGSFEPIPPGEYPAVIVSSEKKPTGPVVEVSDSEWSVPEQNAV